MGDALVIGDAVKPGLELRLALEIFQAVKNLEHDFLAHIVSIPIIVEIPRADVEKRTLITPHQLFVSAGHMEKLRASALDQLFIGEFARVVAG